jgi:transposase
MQFGRSSEKLDRQIEQLELLLEDLEEDLGRSEQTAPLPPAPADEAKAKPARRPLPDHLPREEIVHAAACACPSCGGELRRLGEDVTEILEYRPARFHVVRHVRPKFSCRLCEAIAQAPLPELPIERGRPAPGLLAHVLVSKYADHLPLYRQAGIYAREGVELERSTLADWVGRAGVLLEPLVAALRREVMASPRLHGDDTPVPVLAPGTGKTKTGRLWVYVRDDRPHGGEAPAAAYFYSPDRKGEHPQTHLAEFHGHLHADGYAGFGALYDNVGRQPGPIVEVACWAHARRKFHDVHVRTKSPVAFEALERIGALYVVEDEIRGRPPDERHHPRQERSRPAAEELAAWMRATLPKLSGKSDLAGVMRYTLGRWPALTRYLDDGRLAIDNNPAERALRAVALGRKNWLFAGSDRGGERAAAIYSLIETAKLNGLDPQAWLADVIARINAYPAKRIADLLPWSWKPAP